MAPPSGLGGDAGRAVAEARAAWRSADGTRRLWARDASLWTGGDEARWLGWLDLGAARAALPGWQALAEGCLADGLDQALVLGMGGSSLCPDVLAATFPASGGRRLLRVLDSTDPAQVIATERAVDLRRVAVVVSSKSGSTLEPNLFKDRLLGSVAEAVGAREAPRRFIAITDPGSNLEGAALADGFRAVVHGVPSIGGRFSALSAFGLLPACLIGIDADALLASAEGMAESCRHDDPASNPGVDLGLTLGALSRLGRDKMTIVASPGIGTFGAWLEQLIAESTGKRGVGLVPVEGEPLPRPDACGDDRVFVHLRLRDAAEPSQDAALQVLEKAGHPILRLAVDGPLGLGAEMFRWEMATAVAGHVLGIDPFDQPDVEAAKIAARGRMEEWEKTGSLAPEEALAEAPGLAVHADAANARALRDASPDGSLDGLLAAHLGRISKGDYLALMAWLPQSPATAGPLQSVRQELRDGLAVATTLGFGPRFLHSTGQLHKGGPATGVFLQVTCAHAEDAAIPGRRYGFGVVERAQAAGDMEVLAARGRRVLRLHLTAGADAGLPVLAEALRRALARATRSQD